MSNYDIIDAIIAREGGFVDDPMDRGGATNYGIAQQTLSRYAGFQVTRKDVEKLSIDTARAIYQRFYIEEPHLDKIADMDLRHLVVDSAVQHGPSRAVQWLQKIIGADADGIFGPQTAKLLDNNEPDDIYREYLRKRIMYYAEIVRNTPAQVRFLVGWMSRVTAFLR